MNQVSFKNSALNTTSMSTTKMNETNTTNNKSLKQSKSNNEIKVPFYPASTHLSTNLKKSIAENNAVNIDEKASLFSTWTPLSDEKSNQKLYEERRQLFLKWFETWNDSQRKQVIEDLMNHCKPKQLFYTRDVLNKISPVYQIDFTRVLPRVISLYIMSFLDPRSLCRCAQVSWYWKMLSESDQLWMPKCLRFGWNLNYIPSSFENGIWKQFYIENIKALQYIPLKANTPMITERSELLTDLSTGQFGFKNFAKSNQKSIGKTFKSSGPLKHPPWKGNSFNPNHLYRYNYLDNDEKNEKRSEKTVKNLDKLSQAVICHLNLSSIRAQSAKQVTTANTLKINKNEHYSNQKIIENLIEKGQTLLNEINLKEQYPFKTESITTPTNLFSLNKQTSSILKDQSTSSLLTSASNGKQQQQKAAWNLIDPNEDDDL